MTPMPIATYRLQLNDEFTFGDAERIVDYLADLGVSHLYLSPCLETVEHSTHGYDTVDYSELNPALGGEAAFNSLCETAKRAGLGIILDTVPNHMAISGRKNRWWWDVLRRGITSDYAQYFDIEWTFDNEGQPNKLVVPVLSERYGQALANGDIQVAATESELVIKYRDNEFPLSDSTVAGVSDLATLNRNRELLHELLEHQHYRLAYWGLANEEADYRRFFDINSLIALRQDRREVFDATNNVPLQLIEKGNVDGLRVDHVDGLSNPAQYLGWLRESAGKVPIYVEKILETGERLRPTWPVEGTTGYDMMRLIDGLFIDPDGEKPLETFFQEFTGYMHSWTSTVARCKLELLNESFAGDVARLCDQLETAFALNLDARDFSRREIRRVVIAFASFMPVYRTYVMPESNYIAPDDITHIEQAALLAKAQLPDDLHGLIDLVSAVLTLTDSGPTQSEFVRRFQQLTGPVMAKGVEDRAFYRYFPLTTLNEVGSAPDHFGVRPDEFHERCTETAKSWPKTMVASTTHDTKRSEDHRHRIALLSEMPEKWSDVVRKWDSMCKKHVANDMPDSATRYLLYQTLVGAWPIEVDRIQQYMTKAVREAAVRTSWKDPNEEFETLLRAFIAEIYSDAGFIEAVGAFVETLTVPGRITSLSATVLKLTMPGVPDIYQGTEFWAHQLVDPDNRRQVEYEQRQQSLTKLISDNNIPPIDATGAAKQFVTMKLLALRKRLNEGSINGESPYRQVKCSGERAANVVAFARPGIIVVVPRLVLSLNNDWLDTSLELPAGKWQDVFTNAIYESGHLRLSSLFQQFPVSVLMSK